LTSLPLRFLADSTYSNAVSPSLSSSSALSSNSRP
jgi:hypothetical protein